MRAGGEVAGGALTRGVGNLRSLDASGEVGARDDVVRQKRFSGMVERTCGRG